MSDRILVDAKNTFCPGPLMELISNMKKSIKDLESKGQFNDPIVTEVVPATQFYKAEEYHQKYLLKRGKGSCKI